jgi:C1A family cysteine protease
MQRGLPFGEIYCAAQKRDPWVGDCDNPQYDGTSVRAGAKYLQELGYVGEYLWAFNSTDVTNWLLSGKGPIVLGTVWYNSMFYPDEKGIVPVHPESGGAGGHAYLVVGANLDKGMIRIVNSWGTGWGQNGRAWIKLTDLDKLLQQQGEACTAIEIRK